MGAYSKKYDISKFRSLKATNSKKCYRANTFWYTLFQSDSSVSEMNFNQLPLCYGNLNRAVGLAVFVFNMFLVRKVYTVT